MDLPPDLFATSERRVDLNFVSDDPMTQFAAFLVLADSFFFRVEFLFDPKSQAVLMDVLQTACAVARGNQLMVFSPRAAVG